MDYKSGQNRIKLGGLGNGIWDLRAAEETKLTRLSDAEKKVLSEPDKEFQL